MAKEQLEQLTALIKQTTLGKYKNTGAAVYVNERICISLTPVGFAIKLPEESRNALLKQKGTKHLRYFPKALIKKDYVVLPKTILKDMRTLRH